MTTVAVVCDNFILTNRVHYIKSGSITAANRLSFNIVWDNYFTLMVSTWIMPNYAFLVM